MFERLKYDSVLVTFTEVPDEVALCFNLSGCPCGCQNCFEPWLAEDRGSYFTTDAIAAEIKKHPHITCVCFMGGDRYPIQIADLSEWIKQTYPTLKTAMYSGARKGVKELWKTLDYYKIGPYMPQFGPLNQTTTNQRMYKHMGDKWQDITYRFQEKKH